MSNYPQGKEIIDSFRFYIMIGMLVAQQYPSKKDESLNRFKNELLKKGISEQKIKYYIGVACSTIPNNFNKIMHLDNLMRK